MSHEFANAQVCSIINPVTQCWDANLLNLLFLPHEVLLNQSIPLSQRPVEDKFMWPFNQFGAYNVKSGYKFLSQEVEALDFRAQDVDQDVWMKVWGLTVQNKIKNLLWRAI